MGKLNNGQGGARGMASLDNFEQVEAFVLAEGLCA